MNNRKPILGVLAAAIVLGLVAGAAGAAVLHVANNGTDGAACGAAAAPCRSISQAIANSAAKDRIVVGPGRYGDLNGNGILGEPGEETGTLVVQKPLTLESEEGAGATLLDFPAPGADILLVVSAGSGSVIGKPGKGFTFKGGDHAFVTENAPPFVSELTVSGNIATGYVEFAFLFHASDTSKFTVTDNLAIRSGGGFALNDGAGYVIKNNVAIGSPTGQGFLTVRGTGHSFIGNLAIGNGFHGIEVVGSTNLSFRGNSMIGNTGAGIALQDAATATMSQNNFYGNDPAFNCGLIVGGPGTSVNAVNNYWGAATGPGADPADFVCGNPTIFAPFAHNEFAISTTWR